MASLARSALAAACGQWERAGGHTVTSSTLATPSCETFALLQAAGALEAEAEAAVLSLRFANAGGTLRPPKPREAPPGADDLSDGSEAQAALVAARVARGRREELVHVRPADGRVRAADGSLRLLVSALVSPDECQILLSAGVVMMASAFSRCGQTTLGLSPALVHRLGGCSELAPAVPLLYRAVERARRQVAAAVGTPLEHWRLSDATFTRLRPTILPGETTPAGVVVGALACEAGALDVGVCRGDRFCYWRPHIDQVSVAEYEQSALLYLTTHGKDFEGGRLIFHDEAADTVILPEAGLLVSFGSGVPNLHSVERLTHGSRFALTMWFTTVPPDESAPTDATHKAMMEWAMKAVDAEVAGSGTLGIPPAPLPAFVDDGIPTRDEALVSAAMCSLPPNDPLCSALLTAHAKPGADLGAVLRTKLGLDATFAQSLLGPTISLRSTVNPLANALAAGASIPLGEEPSPLLARLRSRIQTVEALNATLTRVLSGRPLVAAGEDSDVAQVIEDAAALDDINRTKMGMEPSCVEAVDRMAVTKDGVNDTCGRAACAFTAGSADPFDVFD